MSRVEHRVRERVARSAVDLGAVQQLRRNHLRVEHRGIVKIVVQDRPREYAQNALPLHGDLHDQVWGLFEVTTRRDTDAVRAAAAPASGVAGLHRGVLVLRLLVGRQRAVSATPVLATGLILAGELDVGSGRRRVRLGCRRLRHDAALR